MIWGLCAITALGMITLSACGGAKGFPYDGYNLDNYITVGEYKGLEVDGYKITVSQEEVDKAIDNAIQSATKDVELKDGDEVKDGDIVNIDYVGKIDGEKFEGGSAEGYDLTIGSGTFIKGFESKLIGKKIGDKKVKVEVTFPKDYNKEELQGKDAVFTVKINSGKRVKKPEYNDDFAKSQGEYENTADYEKAVKKMLHDQKEAQAIEDQKEALWDKVVTDSEVKEYPQEDVDRYKESNSEQMDAMAKEYDTTREAILSKYGFKDEEEFELTNDESSKLRVKQELIVAKIAENERITFAEEEKQKMIGQFEGQGYTDEIIQEQTGRTMEEYVCIQLLYDKVLDFILDNAKVK